MLADDLPHLEELDVDPSHGRRGLGTAPFYARLGFEELSREILRPELAAVVAEEAHRGLDPATRAVMGYRCGQPAIPER